MTERLAGRGSSCRLLIAACLLCQIGVTAHAQQAPPKPAFEPTLEMVSHLSCQEVWTGVAEDKTAFFEVVELFAHHILTVRNVEFPDSSEVGRKFGEAVVQNCLDDSEELLYSSVNRALRDTLPADIQKH